MLGAFLSTWRHSTAAAATPSSCFQSLPPYTALFLSLANLVFSYRYLPETLPASRRVGFVVLIISLSCNLLIICQFASRQNPWAPVWRMPSTISTRWRCSRLGWSIIWAKEVMLSADRVPQARVPINPNTNSNCDLEQRDANCNCVAMSTSCTCSSTLAWSTHSCSSPTFVSSTPVCNKESCTSSWASSCSSYRVALCGESRWTMPTLSASRWALSIQLWFGLY